GGGAAGLGGCPRGAPGPPVALVAQRDRPARVRGSVHRRPPAGGAAAGAGRLPARGRRLRHHHPGAGHLRRDRVLRCDHRARAAASAIPPSGADARDRARPDARRAPRRPRASRRAPALPGARARLAPTARGARPARALESRAGRGRPRGRRRGAGAGHQRPPAPGRSRRHRGACLHRRPRAARRHAADLVRDGGRPPRAAGVRQPARRRLRRTRDHEPQRLRAPDAGRRARHPAQAVGPRRLRRRRDPAPLDRRGARL
ncbi:MAG: hypothetical protein AVDCRST_MAG38-1285, partial [uncultured Solirubrobacteraceae bacterium]